MIALDSRRDLYQRVIQDHAKKPLHRGRTNPVHRQQQGRTPYCGDSIELTLQISEDGQIIEDIQFEGEGCAIALASADLMADVLKGKNLEEALETVDRFLGMMHGQGEFPQIPKNLSKLNSMKIISHPLRIKCALLAWHTFRAAVHHNKELTWPIRS